MIRLREQVGVHLQGDLRVGVSELAGDEHDVQAVHGWTTLSVAVLALGGRQLISLGSWASNRAHLPRGEAPPALLVDKRLGFESEPDPDEARRQNVV